MTARQFDAHHDVPVTPEAAGPPSHVAEIAGMLAGKMAATGTACQHISNNGPRDLSEMDAERRKAGITVAKKWLDAGTIIGAKSMRVNSGGPRIAPGAVATDSLQGTRAGFRLYRVFLSTRRRINQLREYGAQVSS